MTTAHYCLWFVVAEVNEKTAAWSLVAVLSPLPHVVVTVLSGRVNFTAAQVAGRAGGPLFRAASISLKAWFPHLHKVI